MFQSKIKFFKKKTNAGFLIAFFILIASVLSFLQLTTVGLAETSAISCGTNNSSVLCNPLKADSFATLMEAVSKLAVQIGIPIAALFIIYSGLKLVMAKGEEKAITDAKMGLLWSIIGAGILIGAWTITKILESVVKGLG